MRKTIFGCVLSGYMLTCGAASQEYSPYLDEQFPMQVLWGDTHVHSSFSMDANAMGNTQLNPAEAYRFAKGEQVIANNGMKARLDTPLDFLVVADHAEYMGLLPKLRAADTALLTDKVAKRLFDGIHGSAESSEKTMVELILSLMSNEPVIDNEGLQRSIWNEITEMADAHNEPGKFTALIGYEWSAMPKGDNLHRVVVYADAADKAGKMIPVSAFDGDRPEDLWAFMEKYQATTQGRILAIPHNANVSNGRMFAVEKSDGSAIDRAYAEQRARWEPLVEVTQIKGDSEAHPLLSPDDEFADFENWDKTNLGTTPKKPEMLQYEYARPALKLGLQQQAAIGVNPFKFGMIGSTDSHTSLATAAENNFWGKISKYEPGTARTEGAFMASYAGREFDTMEWQQVASGYSAVWATGNTREAIFDAMLRKEVYATTGSRIGLRFFGGWDYQAEDILRPDMVRIGYRKGVPMGADLPAKSAAAPRFLATAIKDPNGANLDRIQVVKGWHDSEGQLQEKVYNIAASDRRVIAANGRVAALGSTVDVAAASYANSIGDAQLAAYWRDPDFDPSQNAFYYARVMEIPTPRWTAYDANRLSSAILAGTLMTVQDRAYSSPIWYSADNQ